MAELEPRTRTRLQVLVQGCETSECLVADTYNTPRRRHSKLCR